MNRPVVLVVGGGKAGSIGERIVEQLGHEYELWVVDQQYSSSVVATEAVHKFPCDLRQASDIERLAGHLGLELEATGNRFAGIVYAIGSNHLGSVQDLGEGQFDDMVQLNVKALWLLVRELLGYDYVRAKALERPVKVIALGSNTAFVAKTRSFGYAFTKAGLAHMLRCMHRELAPQGWEFTTLDFGIVMDTAMTAKTIQELGEQRGWSEEETHQMLLRNVPTGEPVTRHEIASTVQFLLRPEVRSFGGNSVRFDGGQQQG